MELSAAQQQQQQQQQGFSCAPGEYPPGEGQGTHDDDTPFFRHHGDDGGDGGAAAAAAAAAAAVAAVAAEAAAAAAAALLDVVNAPPPPPPLIGPDQLRTLLESSSMKLQRLMVGDGVWISGFKRFGSEVSWLHCTLDRATA
jgi:hypothetical protein